MGNKCCAESKMENATEQTEVKDLPALDLSGVRDHYQKFELALPFARSQITPLAASI